ncbi:hypothetical protein BU25DRAFT_491039 [Macroventuria anomochaeta]|uniref:Uncharacterized protein n=1 Tax=Macroventuria anomochaeta TaxID=301207 RepID=A0ACB6S1I3_9PLEO|nr:uncharacterized protein BU25DRAFT_491039 [Macroventuria anomochaeta]KAF2627888.1 hypothetical protein BU25DRAFT_491039 [Macroventuria anomochaeta]
MPLLKDLNCSIELSDDQEPLQELGTVYGDACVETFVPVPKKQQTFTVHLSSKNFIAPGIAMYVFIDGIYQCNRNRQNMKLRRPPDRRSLVDFKVRQKEERQKDGSMIAREWTFEKLDHASADGAPDSCSPNILENIGCIEVVVLRCAGPRNVKTTANMNLDGATDYPDYHFDRDSRSRTTAYDDRDPFVSTASNKHGPPPAVPSYRSPYAETMRSREHSKRAYSRYSEPVSPGMRPQRDIPAPAFQYGSGPLPPRSRAETHKELMDEVAPSSLSRGAPTIDHDILGKIVADAVKRGVEESRKKDKPDGSRMGSRRSEHDVEDSSQVPGAWPASPTHASKHRSQRWTPSGRYDRDHDRHDHDSTGERHPDAPKRRPTRSRAETRIAWDEEPGWDKQSRADGWSSPGDNPADSWGTEETWSKKPPDDWEEVRRRSRSRSRTVRTPSPPRRASHNSGRVSDRRHSRHDRSHESRSRSHSHWVDETKSSSEDNDGWTRIEAPSDSTTSLERSDSTLKPSHSRSQVQPPRSKSARRSSGRERSRNGHERKLSQLVENPQWHPESVHHARPPSVLVTNASTLMSAPISHYPADVRSRKPSAYTQPAASIIAPPPTWGCASEKGHKNSAATTYLPPAPFSTIGADRHESRQSSGSSSWGITGKVASKEEDRKSLPQQFTWGDDKNSEKAQSAWGNVGNKTTDWNNDQTKGWGDSDAAEQNDGSWNNDEKGDSGWGISNDTKDAAADGWNTNNNNNNNDNWGQTDTKIAAVDGWNTDNKNDNSKDEQNDTDGFEGWDANNAWGAAQDTDTAWDQPQDTTKDVPFSADAGNSWAAPAAPVADDKATEKAKSSSISKRHTSKSLSKYRQLSSPSLAPKAHWQFPPPSSKRTLRPATSDQASEKSGRTRLLPSVPSEPLYKIPKSAADEKGIQHQVLAGPGTEYGHAVSRPEYLDGLDKPYAVFRFKYRSRSMLRGMFGSDCLSKSGTAPKVVGKEDLKALPQEELIKKMMALQSKLEEKEGGKDGGGDEVSQCTESVAKDLTEKWVKDHSRNPSEQGKAKAKSEKSKAKSAESKAKSAEKVAGWDDGAEDWQKNVNW